MGRTVRHPVRKSQGARLTTDRADREAPIQSRQQPPSLISSNRHVRLFTKQLLCQLSYAGVVVKRSAVIEFDTST